MSDVLLNGDILDVPPVYHKGRNWRGVDKLVHSTYIHESPATPMLGAWCVRRTHCGCYIGGEASLSNLVDGYTVNNTQEQVTCFGCLGG